MADQIFLVNSSSFQDVEVSASLRAAAGIIVDFSQASEVTGTFVGQGANLTNVSASYIVSNSNTTSSQAVSASVALSSSYVNPGAMLWVVSGSNGVSPAFLAPYDYSVDNVYRPAPIKEGYTHWDHKWNDWAVYDDSGARTHLGREIVFAVHNPTAATLPRMAAVYISGSSPSPSLNPTWSATYKPDVYLAIADGTGTKTGVVGIVRQAIPSGSDGYVLQTGTLHNSNVTPYGDVGTQLWLSPTVPGGLTSTQPGQPNEVVSVAYVIEAGTVGSLLVQTRPEPPPANAYAGMTSIPTITDNTSSFEVYIGSGSVNLYDNDIGAGAITQYPILPATFSVVVGLDAEFVYATSNGVTASYEITTDFNSINGTTKALVTTLYRADEDAHWMESKNEGLALANKLNTRLLETDKFAWESGFTLIPTGSNYLTITDGQIWFGATNISQDSFNSFDTASVNPKYETHWAYHSASVWTIPIQTDGKWSSGYYDDETNLVALGPNSWSVHYIYRILGENPFDEDIFIVTSNYQYPTAAEAQADSLPAGIPPVLDDVALMVGRLIFQSGSTTATAETAFGNNFGQSTVTQHNSLGGLQGGTGGQYWHLSLTDYTGTGTSTLVRQDGATINQATITATGSLKGTASYSNDSSFSISSSFASRSVSASYAPFTQTEQVSGSWSSASFVATSASFASRSISASYSLTASSAVNAFLAATATTATSATSATSASWSSASFVATSASFASQSISASWAPGGSGTTLVTASTYQITASWANDAISASWAPGGSGTTLVTASTYQITASWANSALFSGVIFSKGVTFFDPAGISGTASLSQSVIAWRAPFACTASAIYGWKSGGTTTSTASVQIKKNTLPILTSSLFVTQSGAWVSKGAAALQNQNFSVGDYMEIVLHTASFYVTQVGVQIDLIRQ